MSPVRRYSFARHTQRALVVGIVAAAAACADSPPTAPVNAPVLGRDAARNAIDPLLVRKCDCSCCNAALCRSRLRRMSARRSRV